MKRINILIISLLFLTGVSIFAANKPSYQSKKNTFNNFKKTSPVKTYKKIFISDIHLGDKASIEQGYCWMNKHIPVLEDFLTNIMNDPELDEIVILGDLFDEWICPPENNPLNHVQTDSEKFKDIASAPQNRNIINILKEIITNTSIKLTYVPGNHDMLLNEETLNDILPGINYNDDVYALDDGKVIAEHGHRYDIYNAKNSISQPGHTLPLGFFITRITTKIKNKSTQSPVAMFTKLNSLSDNNQGLKLNAGWIDFPMKAYSAAAIYCKRNDNDTITMNGIDNYSNIKVKDVKKLFEFTDDKWKQIRDNDVVTDWQESMWMSSSKTPDFYTLAEKQYFKNSKLNKPDIVIFGHTHKALIKKHNSGSIYVNTGSWVDEIDRCIYVEVEKDIDGLKRVRLFDYNNNNKLLSEMSI